ncbi:YgfZ/GcvT domain-containing protein [Benzoatithermus flavus]|uniref:CAF17 C-terminal domain-containing protein n=1 Tax=Benzoatithermus flavus TaxID=3108223 RepID=A0ABU8XSA2_9PROT
MSDPRCVVLANRSVVRLVGEDTRGFLQGLVSNDINLLATSRSLYAALLTPQGKYLFDFLLHEAADGAVLLDGERERLPALIQRLSMYRLRAKVAIEDASAGKAVLAVLGREAAGIFDLPPQAGAARVEGDAVLAVDPRTAELGVRVVLPRADLDGFVAAHGLAPAPFAAYDHLRLELGVPDGSRDLVVEKSILLESGFEELHGVSFTKGCFVGQELTARTKHRGLVKKRLVPVRIEGPVPAPGTPVFRGGRDAGEMRSALQEAGPGSGAIGLALLRLEQLGPDAAATGPLVAGDAVLIPAPPPWLQLELHE